MVRDLTPEGFCWCLIAGWRCRELRAVVEMYLVTLVTCYLGKPGARRSSDDPQRPPESVASLRASNASETASWRSFSPSRGWSRFIQFGVRARASGASGRGLRLRAIGHFPTRAPDHGTGCTVHVSAGDRSRF